MPSRDFVLLDTVLAPNMEMLTQTERGYVVQRLLEQVAIFRTARKLNFDIVQLAIETVKVMNTEQQLKWTTALVVKLTPIQWAVIYSGPGTVKRPDSIYAFEEQIRVLSRFHDWDTGNWEEFDTSDGPKGILRMVDDLVEGIEAMGWAG